VWGAGARHKVNVVGFTPELLEHRFVLSMGDEADAVPMLLRQGGGQEGEGLDIAPCAKRQDDDDGGGGVGRHRVGGRMVG